MKKELEEKERSEPWYKGMSNMTDEEIDKWWMGELRVFMIFAAYTLIILAITLIAMWFGTGITETTDKDKGISIIGFFLMGMLVPMLIELTYMSRQRRLVKGERKG